VVGYDLIAVARNPEQLEALATRLMNYLTNKADLAKLEPMLGNDASCELRLSSVSSVSSRKEHPPGRNTKR
jgi:hypothetical protein